MSPLQGGPKCNFVILRRHETSFDGLSLGLEASGLVNIEPKTVAPKCEFADFVLFTNRYSRFGQNVASVWVLGVKIDTPQYVRKFSGGQDFVQGVQPQSTPEIQPYR